MATVGMPVATDFEDTEFVIPRDRLAAAGHTVVVLGATAGESIDGKRGEQVARIDLAVSEANPADFDALVIPGGYSPDHLRSDPKMVAFVQKFGKDNRLIAAVCHGPQLLIEADLVRGRRLTSWPSVRKDLEHAGARWVDVPVCIDGNLITSRKPDDLEEFSQAIIDRLAAAASKDFVTPSRPGRAER
jgi:protease I